MCVPVYMCAANRTTEEAREQGSEGAKEGCKARERRKVGE